MLLYNFDAYIGNSQFKSKIHQTDPDLDIFRKEYPPHVVNTANCFRNIERNPKRWNYFLRVHRISRIRFKKLTGLYSISEDRIRFLLRKHY